VFRVFTFAKNDQRSTLKERLKIKDKSKKTKVTLNESPPGRACPGLSGGKGWVKIKKKSKSRLRIEILNPKVKTILKQLADLDLIAISKMESPEIELKNLLKKFRSKSKEAPTLDEITSEIEVVRAERYAGKKD
jgi:hypothetical protein